MTLYKDELIELVYNTTQDILYMEPQHSGKLSVSDIRKIFISTVACTREHNITKLLIDLTRCQIELTNIEYKHVMAQLAVGLMPTHVQKVARVRSTDADREQKVGTAYEEIRGAVNLPLEFRNYAAKAEAIAWLSPSIPVLAQAV